MLEGLDQVEWGRLTHAHGRAGDIPGFIRQLTSPDKAVREIAQLSLFSTINPSAMRYPASAAAVPFLFELLNDPDTQEKLTILQRLLFLAVGHPDLLPLRFDQSKEFAEAEARARLVDLEEMRMAGADEDDEWDPDRQCLWHMDVYRAVLRGIATFQKLTQHADEHVCQAAFKALAWFPDAAASSAPIVRQIARRQEDSRERPTAILCLGFLARYLKDMADVPWLQEQLAPTHAYGVRVRAATALAVILGRAMPAEALTTLLEAIEDANRREPDSKIAAWHQLGWVDQTCEVLADIRPEATEEVLSALCRAAELIDSLFGAKHVFRTLLSIVFPVPSPVKFQEDPTAPEGIRDVYLDPAQLTTAQLRALRAIGRNPVWRRDPVLRIGDVCNEFGLPAEAESYHKLLDAAER